MRIIDTHSHIYHADFDGDIDDVITRAKNVGVEQILLPNIDSSTIIALNRLADAYPSYCIPMMGLHPTSVKEDWQIELATIEAQFAQRNYVAIGEIGIDLYWDKSFAREQIEAFEEQLRWSIVYDLPVVIHSRSAIKECIQSIYNIGTASLRGVFHSFGGDENELKEILALRHFLIGINGVVTFKNSRLDMMLKNIDLAHIIIETDAPYLSPVPYRGKRNEPSYTSYIVDRLANIYALSPSEVGDITTENAEKLFKLKK